jgi:hypothetical protein
VSPSPFDLLRLLGSGVRATTEPTPAKTVEDSQFKELLDKAKAGQVPSGIEARLADGVSINLSPEQMKRLTIAGDKAEAAGASRAMILMDGLAFTMDVGTRTITRAVKASGLGVVGDVDAVISADAPGPASHASGDALLKALAPADDRSAA